MVFLLFQDEGWKLDRTNYYQEGWLATGNARGLVGVTFTTSHCRTRTTELPLRANYNLRGHRSEVNFISFPSYMYVLFFPFPLLFPCKDVNVTMSTFLFFFHCFPSCSYGWYFFNFFLWKEFKKIVYEKVDFKSF